MPHFRPFLSFGLENYQEHQVCSIAVGVVGDICRALEGKFAPYCDEIIVLLLRNLQNPKFSRTVKPSILSSFGDIALAIEGQFEKYLDATMQMLQQASRTEASSLEGSLSHSEAHLEYLSELREAIFEAFTGVLQGLKASNKGNLFEPYMLTVAELLQRVEQESTHNPPSDELIRAAVGAAGDLGSVVPRFKSLAHQPEYKGPIMKLIKEACRSSEEATAQVGRWATSVIY